MLLKLDATNHDLLHKCMCLSCVSEAGLKLSLPSRRVRAALLLDTLSALLAVECGFVSMAQTKVRQLLCRCSHGCRPLANSSFRDRRGAAAVYLRAHPPAAPGLASVRLLARQSCLLLHAVE